VNDTFVDDVIADLKADIAEEYRVLAGEIERYVIDLISVPVAHGRGFVIRSAPGEPPRRDVGGLVASIHSEVIEGADGPDTITLSVYSDSPVATFLEYGTAVMAARPFLGPAFDFWADEVVGRSGKGIFRAGPVAGT
jgi:hypothetical protein